MKVEGEEDEYRMETKERSKNREEEYKIEEKEREEVERCSGIVRYMIRQRCEGERKEDKYGVEDEERRREVMKRV